MGPSSGETIVFCDNWNLLFCVDDCQVCRVHTRLSSTQN